MIKIHGTKEKTSEYAAAERLVKIALEALPNLEGDPNLVLELFPSVQCFGQRIQDINLLVFFANYGKAQLETSTKNQVVQSFCASFEVKRHSTDAVRFEGNRCIVRYNDQEHDVTNQSEGQKYSVRDYIKKNSRSGRAPYITNLIWLHSVPCRLVPNIQNNILGSDFTWKGILDKIALVSGRGGATEVACFSSRNYLAENLSVFSRTLTPSKIDRKRLEAITKSILDRSKQQYANNLGRQLLIFRGRGGTGKTVRLIRIAYQAYDEMGLRVVLLTYNKALVADLRRLLALLGVKDAVGEGSIAIKTIHSFMHEWLVSLGVIRKDQGDYLKKYEEYKMNALELLNGGAIETNDIEAARTKASKDLTWDLLLIDESQDWPVTERDMIYRLYGFEKVIIADGVDQFVRGVERIDWKEGISTDRRQIVPLRKSLRLKESLCQTVGYFAEEIEFENWNLQPLPESHGGRVIVISGDPMSRQFHRRLAATAKDDGNKPIDMLFCVPPSWVDKLEDGEGRQSRVAKQYKAWGLDCWDAVDPEQRDSYPTRLEQYRIVQYESCRGLEGWVVVNFALDEFFEYKRGCAEISESIKADMFFDEEQSSLEYAKKWIMIPLTRAIDTLVSHVSDPDSYIGKVALKLHRKYPENVYHYEF